MDSSIVETHRTLLPLVPLRDQVVFPHTLAPFIVGREVSIRALRACLETGRKRLFLVTQKDPRIDRPEGPDLYGIGVVARVLQHVRLPRGIGIKVTVEGLERGRLLARSQRKGVPTAEVETYSVHHPVNSAQSALIGEVLQIFRQYRPVASHLDLEEALATIPVDDADRFCDMLSALLMVNYSTKQSLLDLLDSWERLQHLKHLVENEIEAIESRKLHRASVDT